MTNKIIIRTIVTLALLQGCSKAQESQPTNRTDIIAQSAKQNEVFEMCLRLSRVNLKYSGLESSILSFRDYIYLPKSSENFEKRKNSLIKSIDELKASLYGFDKTENFEFLKIETFSALKEISTQDFLKTEDNVNGLLEKARSYQYINSDDHKIFSDSLSAELEQTKITSLTLQEVVKAIELSFSADDTMKSEIKQSCSSK